MEPLVLFGAGLVFYCGYLAFVDEMSDIRRNFAKNGVRCRRKTAAREKSPVRKTPGQRGRYTENRAYACGRLQAMQLR
jgi:hypothetical protein